MAPPGRSAAENAAWLTRNAVDCLPAGALERKLGEAGAAGRQLRVKLGIDPTAPDIHLGHTVVLRKLAEFQSLGHVVLLIIGDYTARVGDPSGRSSMRPQLSAEQIAENAATFQQQASLVLDTDPQRLEVHRNSKWLDMAMDELLRLASTTTVAQLLERDDFSRRQRSQTPISILELLYPLLQGYDSVAVRADVELGGTDQSFNLLLGRDIQRAYGQPEQVVLTMPIMVGIDGRQKMSKSLGNHIGVTDSAAEIYGRTLKLPDDAMDGWYELALGEPRPTDLAPRDTKRALARALVERLHDAAAAERAEQEFDRVFIDQEAPREIEEGNFAPDGDGNAHLPAVIAGLFDISRSEARRLLEQGGVGLGERILTGDDQDLPAASLDGEVLRVGKRRFRRLRRQR